MKKQLFVFVFFLALLPAGAQTGDISRLNERLTLLENRAALKALVDTFSILADVKDAQAQTLLFTADALVETFQNGQLITRLEGRKQIGEVFGNFLSGFKTVYHFNGQHAVTINGDSANGILYCLTVLITPEGAKRTIGIWYKDEYVCENGKWLIAHRRSYFEWQEVQQDTL